MAGEALPSADEFFSAGAPAATPAAPEMVLRNSPMPAAAVGAAKPLPSADEFFGAPTDNIAARTDREIQRSMLSVFGAFGYGAQHAFGTDPIGLTDETIERLKQDGIFNDFKSGRDSFFKAVVEGVMRSSAAGWDVAQRGVTAAGAGALQATGQALEETHLAERGSLTGEGGLAGAMTDPGVQMALFPELAGGHIPDIDLARARASRVIGEGEAGWKGTAAEAPKAVQDARQAAAESEAIHGGIGFGAGLPEEPAPAVGAAAEAATHDVHSLARQIEPEAFREYDDLTARRDLLRRQISDLGEARAESEPAKAAQERIDTILGKVSGVEDRLTKAAAGRLEDARAEREQFLSTDTAEMKAARDDLQKLDYRMRDLSTSVTRAYREAESQLPTVAEEAPTAAPVGEAAPEPSAVAPPARTETLAPQEAAVPQRTIAADVSQKLVSAGRPQEEATAAAALVQAHYEARAARFGGKKGTAQEMYERDGADIQGAEKGGRKGGAAGKTVLKDGRATITLFGKADASTMVHETGHHWLNELVADAKDAAAPTDVTADASAVRKWLGVRDGEDIPTRAHEKFARGFERYLMEGTAPSRELATVFAKFRDWLTKIYQTVARLRAPITDDIRAVFDRLLAEKPERTVIAPERKTGQTLADLHEADAETTPAEHAGPVADHIDAEIEQTTQEKAPEHADEIRGPAGGGKSRGISASDTGVSGGPTAPKPTGGEAGNAAPTGEKPAGGDQAAQEGAGVRTVAKSEPGPTGEPNARLPEPESRLVDKAGNIRVENLNTSADVENAIREMADQNEGFSAARRGVVSDAEVLDLADAMGLKPEDLDVGTLRQNFSAERIVASRKLLVQTASDARALAVAAADGSDAQVLAYAEARSRLRMVQEYVSAITAEAGRGLRAFQRLDDVKNVTEAMGDISEARTLFQMRAEAKRVASLDTAAKVSGFVRQAGPIKPGIGAMLLEAYTNWLISGPLTHMGYSVGNTLLALWRAVPETIGEAAAGAIREGITGQRGDRVRLGEVGAQLYGMVRGQRNGVQAAWDAFKTGQTSALPGEGVGKVKMPFTPPQAIPGLAGTVIRVPGERMIAPIHSYFRSIGYSQSIARQAYRAAATEGLTGDAFHARIAELTKQPTEAMMTAAREDATQQTLMGKGGGLTQKVSALMNWEPNVPGLGPTRLLRFIDPFVHIAANIVEQSVLERGPLGVLATHIREDISGKNGPLAQDAAIAKMAVGTSLSIVGGGLAMEGIITPSAPADPKEAAVWNMVNGLPHAIRIGDMAFDISRLGPLGFQLGIAADLYHAAEEMGKDDITKVGSLLVHSFTQNFLDEGFMRGPSDLIKALDDPDRYGQTYIKNFISTAAVPFSVGMGQVARQIDPYSREARTLLDSIKAKIPGVSETLFPRRDLWGQEIPNREWAVVYSQRVQNDPVNRALTTLGYFPARPEHKIRGIELTGQQYDDFSRIAGRTAKLRLNAIVGQRGFMSLPPEVQLNMVQSAIKDSREMARDMVMMRNPQIAKQAHDAKVAPLKKATAR